MSFSDDTVMAYVDGELDAATRVALEHALADDRELAARVQRQRKLRALLHQTYDAVLDEPVPERLVRALRKSTRAAAKKAWHERLRAGLQPLAGAPALAMAACAVLGVAIGVGLASRSDAPFALVQGEVVARGALARALDERLASDAPAGDVRLAVSFTAKDGRTCRSFALGREAGLACRADAHWRVEVLAGAAPGQRTDYRPAGAELPPEVLRAIDARIAGDALDAQGEREARARGWKARAR